MIKNSTEHQEQSIAQQNVELRIIGRKICTKCKVEKSTDEFYKGRSNKLQSWCKKCKRESKRSADSDLFELEKIPYIEGFLYCYKCRQHKEINLNNFHKSRINRFNGNNRYSECRICRNLKVNIDQKDNRKDASRRHKMWRDKNRGHVRHKSKLRKLSVKKAAPIWFEYEMVKKVYEMACFYGFEVDHIVPINSDVVCGLHCHANLQILHKEINGSKSNRHWPDMP